jgi:hypothetical protein
MVFFMFWSIKSIFHLSKYSLKQYYWYNFPQKRINAKTSLINRNYKIKTYIQKLLTNNIYRSTVFDNVTWYDAIGNSFKRSAKGLLSIDIRNKNVNKMIWSDKLPLT